MRPEVDARYPSMMFAFFAEIPIISSSCRLPGYSSVGLPLTLCAPSAHRSRIISELPHEPDLRTLKCPDLVAFDA